MTGNTAHAFRPTRGLRREPEYRLVPVTTSLREKVKGALARTGAEGPAGVQQYTPTGDTVTEKRDRAHLCPRRGRCPRWKEAETRKRGRNRQLPTRPCADGGGSAPGGPRSLCVWHRPPTLAGVPHCPAVRGRGSRTITRGSLVPHTRWVPGAGQRSRPPRFCTWQGQTLGPHHPNVCGTPPSPPPSCSRIHTACLPAQASSRHPWTGGSPIAPCTPKPRHPLPHSPAQLWVHAGFPALGFPSPSFPPLW